MDEIMQTLNTIISSKIASTNVYSRPVKAYISHSSDELLTNGTHDDGR